ncbi:MAG: aminotransferase class I/II-fold pyridoxal phosphate-dependent enzyme, partial [Alphaproteobacteria bacterium]
MANEGIGLDGVIPLWFGESDEPTPAFVKDAAIQALAADKTHYAPNRGVPELLTAVADYMTGLHGRPFDEARVTVTASGMNAIMLVMQALVDPGDRVAIVAPIWPNCVETVHIMGGAAEA